MYMIGVEYYLNQYLEVNRSNYFKIIDIDYGFILLLMLTILKQLCCEIDFLTHFHLNFLFEMLALKLNFILLSSYHDEIII